MSCLPLSCSGRRLLPADVVDKRRRDNVRGVAMLSRVQTTIERRRDDRVRALYGGGGTEAPGGRDCLGAGESRGSDDVGAGRGSSTHARQTTAGDDRARWARTSVDDDDDNDEGQFTKAEPSRASSRPPPHTGLPLTHKTVNERSTSTCRTKRGRRRSSRSTSTLYRSSSAAGRICRRRNSPLAPYPGAGEAPAPLAVPYRAGAQNNLDTVPYPFVWMSVCLDVGLRAWRKPGSSWIQRKCPSLTHTVSQHLVAVLPSSPTVLHLSHQSLQQHFVTAVNFSVYGKTCLQYYSQIIPIWKSPTSHLDQRKYRYLNYSGDSEAFRPIWATHCTGGNETWRGGVDRSPSVQGWGCGAPKLKILLWGFSHIREPCKNG